MRVLASGNLTVELIRAQRFDPTYPHDTAVKEGQHINRAKAQDHQDCRVDRVSLSPQAGAYDPWATPVDRAEPAIEPTKIDTTSSDTQEQAIDPRPLSPVRGASALTGLGTAWLVPGTLLDVVA